MDRIYDKIVQQHLKRYRQMLFLAGPRQAGKTTCGRAIEGQYSNFQYINWDIPAHRQLITASPEEQAAQLGLDELGNDPVVVMFDEVHKYSKWKGFLKGFFDLYEKKARVIVTGSARLTVYQKGGDSLMGRYLYYRLHPLSLAELVSQELGESPLIPPQPIDDDKWENLIEFGGFPEPFLVGSKSFWARWKRLRQQQLFREDLRDISRIHDLGQVELLSELIRHQAGQLTSYSSLARKVNVTAATVQNWLATLRSVYYLFEVKPWSRNVARSLIKEPKFYLWDWSLIKNEGARFENMVASHLLKAVHLWTDLGLGEFDLYFLRDKDQREVDFLVTKDNKPWFLVECKLSNGGGISKNLYHFQKQIEASHAFQVVQNMPYVEQDCFAQVGPVIVPARTLLSQLQ